MLLILKSLSYVVVLRMYSPLKNFSGTRISGSIEPTLKAMAKSLASIWNTPSKSSGLSMTLFVGPLRALSGIVVPFVQSSVRESVGRGLNSYFGMLCT